MNDLITLQDAINSVSRFVENGSGSCDQDTVIDRINEACARLAVKADWPFTTVKVRARIDNRYFPLPEELAALRAVRIDNFAAAVNPSTFEFMSSGPGELESWSGTGLKDIEDAGMFPTMYDIPSIDRPTGCGEVAREFVSDGLQIMAFSTSQADSSLSITVRGKGKYAADLTSSAASFEPGEDIRIVPWQGSEGVLTGELADLPKSVGLYRQVTALAKPETAGHVSVYAVEVATNRMWLLAKVHAFVKNPVWRRYKIRNQSCCGSNVLMLGKLAARKLRSLDDVLPIQNISAVKFMIMALESENKEQLKSALEFEAQAVRMLVEQKDDHDSQGPTVQVIDHQTELFGSPLSRYISR